jgi:hypothetical protein
MLDKIVEVIFRKTGMRLPKSTAAMLVVLATLLVILLGSFIYRASVLGIGLGSTGEEEVPIDAELLY